MTTAIPDPAALPTDVPAVPPATPPETPPTPTPPPVQLATPETPPATPPAASDVVFEYTPTGDPGLDLALDFVGARGFGPEHPAIVAAQAGDFAALETALKAQGDAAKGHEKFLALAKQSFENGKAKRTAAEEATRKVIYEAAGGEANWAAVQAWAAANADPAERAQINAALAAGGLQAQWAVQGLVALYSKVPKTAPPASALKPGAGAAPASNGNLTSREYSLEVQKLRNTLGTKLETSPEYLALTARRRASRAAGIN